jgi:hypothetical protein
MSVISVGSCSPDTILALHRGSQTAALLYIVLRARGLRIPLLAIIAIGMMLAVRSLMRWLVNVASCR